MRVRLNNVAANYFSYPVGGSGEKKRFRAKVDNDVLLCLCVGDAYRKGVSFSLHHFIVTVINSYVKSSIA